MGKLVILTCLCIVACLAVRVDATFAMAEKADLAPTDSLGQTGDEGIPPVNSRGQWVGLAVVAVAVVLVVIGLSSLPRNSDR